MEWLKMAVCLGCLLVLFKVQGSSAIKCYSCTFMDGACKDPFDKNAAVKQSECGSSIDTCSKTKLKDKVTSRGCGLPGAKSECAEAGDAKACICKGNLCNGSTTVTASISTLAALVLGLGILTRM